MISLDARPNRISLTPNANAIRSIGTTVFADDDVRPPRTEADAHRCPFRSSGAEGLVRPNPLEWMVSG
jgi:hypothetical protein